MEFKDLYNGIAVIIDDEIEADGTEIKDLVDQIQTQNFPCVKYTELPNLDSIKHMEAISFLLLDWNLNPSGLSVKDTMKGVKPGATAKAGGVKESIEFLKELKKNIFAPIFIFTNEDPGPIINKLIKEKLYDELGQNSIFVKNKKELIGGKFFDEITSWLKESTSVYVLKEWDREYKRAKNQLFGDFYNMNPAWPRILWDNYGSDGVNPSSELGEVISKNLHTRMAPFAFDENVIKKEGGEEPDRSELRKVLMGERFIRNERLDMASISTGDLFKIDKTVYVNIRPDCDCIPDRKNEESQLDDVVLYLLRADPLGPSKESEAYDVDYGLFAEQDNNSTVFCMYDEKTYSVRFKNLFQWRWGEIKEERKGRLLPPYITRVQQRYALYLKRQALPKTPEAAVKTPKAAVKTPKAAVKTPKPK